MHKTRNSIKATVVHQEDMPFSFSSIMIFPRNFTRTVAYLKTGLCSKKYFWQRTKSHKANVDVCIIVG